jgi:hypothetical protein
MEQRSEFVKPLFTNFEESSGNTKSGAEIAGMKSVIFATLSSFFVWRLHLKNFIL